MNTIKQVSIIILCLSLSVSALWLTHRADVLSRKGEEIATNVQDATGSVAAAASTYSEQVRSPQNLKSIEHGMELGKVATETVVKLNRTTIPRLNSAIDDLRSNNLASLNRLTVSLDDTVRHTDLSLNSDNGLLVAGTALVKSMTTLSDKFAITVGDLDGAIKDAAWKANKSLDAMYALIADPHIVGLLTNLDLASASTAKLMAEIAKAGESAPGIASSLEKIAKESSKFARITLIANILGTLGRAFLP
ncbi:MAG TPA: hypothetical protein VN743_02250 [Blastocatellia bacterium]|nr:hypothetical protein [Blastocatellia bacterium]